MSVRVVDRLEAVQIDETECKGLAGLGCSPYCVGEQAVKTAPVGQPGQIVGQRYGHRRQPRFLRDALLFGDHESRPHDFGEHAKMLVEHPDDETCGDGD